MKASTILTAAVSATAAMTFATLPASANAGKNFERRIDRQAERIFQGIRSGELTRYEARKLRAENNRIARTLRRFCRDDHLSYSEKRRMRHLLSVANDNIYAEKHDRERRFARGWRNRHDRYDRVSERFNDSPWYSYRRYTRRWW